MTRNLRWTIFILGSFVAHALLAFSLRTSSIRSEQEVSSQIKVRIAFSQPEQSPNQKPPVTESPKALRKSVKSGPAKAPSRAEELPKRRGAAISSPVGSYGDLFPSAAGTTEMMGSEAVAMGGDGTEVSFETNARNYGKLIRFANELSQYVSIPSAVRDLEPSGKATLHFARVGGNWKIKSVQGERYFRAILYEALQGLKPNSYAFELLQATEYTSIRINLSLMMVSPLDRSKKPLSVSTSGNRIYFAFTNARSESEWQMAMPIVNDDGTATVLPNIVGIGMYVAGRVSREDPASDTYARKLRQSPAFARPIGR